MKKTLSVSLLCLALLSSCGLKKVDIETSVSKEGKKESVNVKLSFTLASATGRMNKALSELEVAVTALNAKHEDVRKLANQVRREYTQLVYEVNPAPEDETFVQVLAAVRPDNGEEGTALEQLNQRVQFVEFQTGLRFLALEQTFEEVCHLTEKPKEWRVAQKAKMEALTVSIEKIKRVIADVEALAPEVAKEASRRPQLRNPLVQMQNKGDFLTELVTVDPKEALQEELFLVAKAWTTQPERPNLKLTVRGLALTDLAKKLLEETAKSN